MLSLCGPDEASTKLMYQFYSNFHKPVLMVKIDTQWVLRKLLRPTPVEAKDLNFFLIFSVFFNPGCGTHI